MGLLPELSLLLYLAHPQKPGLLWHSLTLAHNFDNHFNSIFHPLLSVSCCPDVVNLHSWLHRQGRESCLVQPRQTSFPLRSFPLKAAGSKASLCCIMRMSISSSTVQYKVEFLAWCVESHLGTSVVQIPHESTIASPQHPSTHQYPCTHLSQE